MDILILRFIQENIRCEFLDAAMGFFSVFGNYGLPWIILGISMLFWKKSRIWGIMLLSSLALTALTGELAIKNIICRPRPFVSYNDIVLNIAEPSGYSFPSGHSASSFTAAFILYKSNRKIGIAGFLLAALIAFSRLYNFVHYPTDVLAGITLGILVAVIVYFVYKKRFNPAKISLTSKGK